MIFHVTQSGGYAGKYSIAELDEMIYNQDYIPVASATDLDNLRNATTQQMGAGTPYWGSYSAGLDKKYIQINNIDLTAYQGGNGWNPIGDSTTAFTGVYDGNYFKISNCVINNPTVAYQGMFGYISGAKIKNLEVSDFNITGNSYVGVIGYVASVSEVSHVTSKDGFVVGTSTGSVGGMFGVFSSGTANWLTVDNVSVSSTFALNTVNMGGMVGCILTTVPVFSFCVVKNSTISKPNGLNAIDARIGGFCGISQAKVNNSYVINTSVYGVGGGGGYPGIGGFVGRTTGGGPTFTNCYSSSIISKSGPIPIGGFCGVLGTGTITNSYYDTDISGQTDTGKGLPRSTNQIKQGTADSTVDGEAMYTGWDANIWDFGDNNSYPILK